MAQQEQNLGESRTGETLVHATKKAGRATKKVVKGGKTAGKALKKIVIALGGSTGTFVIVLLLIATILIGGIIAAVISSENTSNGTTIADPDLARVEEYFIQALEKNQVFPLSNKKVDSGAEKISLPTRSDYSKLDKYYMYASFVIVIEEEMGYQNKVIKEWEKDNKEYVWNLCYKDIACFFESRTDYQKSLITTDENLIFKNLMELLEAETKKSISTDKKEDIKQRIADKKKSLQYGTMSGAGGDIVAFAEQFLGEGHSRFTGYKSKNSLAFPDDWCAMFVSYCTDNLGYIDAGIVHWFNGCTSMGIRVFESEGRLEKSSARGGNYSPNPGDIIFFTNDGVSSYHVGIVGANDNGKLTTIEGNTNSNSWTSSVVGSHSYDSGASKIYGYFPLSKYVTTDGGNSSKGGNASTGKWSIRSSAPTTFDKAYNPPINNWPSMFDHGSNAGNCTAYAWGRVFETQAIKMNINGNAGDWWHYNSSNTTKSQTPKAGAVLCWSGNGAGHVAFVEKVNEDGSLIITESGYYSFRWKKRTVTNAENYGWSNYHFQGFIIPKK